jgi:hypothetical protein
VTLEELFGDEAVAAQWAMALHCPESRSRAVRFDRYAFSDRTTCLVLGRTVIAGPAHTGPVLVVLRHCKVCSS